MHPMTRALAALLPPWRRTDPPAAPPGPEFPLRPHIASEGDERVLSWPIFDHRAKYDDRPVGEVRLRVDAVEDPDLLLCQDIQVRRARQETSGVSLREWRTIAWRLLPSDRLSPQTHMERLKRQLEDAKVAALLDPGSENGRPR